MGLIVSFFVASKRLTAARTIPRRHIEALKLLPTGYQTIATFEIEIFSAKTNSVPAEYTEMLIPLATMLIARVQNPRLIV